MTSSQEASKPESGGENDKQAENGNIIDKLSLASIEIGGQEGVPHVVPSGNQSVATSCSGNIEETPAISAKQQAALQERQNLAKRETRAILWLRVLVVILFILIGISTAFAVYYWVKYGQEEAYQIEFEFNADRIMGIFIGEVEQKMNAIDNLSLGITSYALQSGSTFPNVTVPHFEYKGSNTRIAGDSILAFYMPIVTDENKLQWESYVRESFDHIPEASFNEQKEKRAQDEKYGLDRPELSGSGYEALRNGYLSDPNTTVVDQIWFPDIADVSENKGPYFPIWHMTPLTPPGVDLINLDFSKYDLSKGSLGIVASTGLASLDIFTSLEYNPDESYEGIESVEAAIVDLFIQLGQYRHDSEHYLGDPISSFSYPVFDNFKTNHTVVGAIFSSLYWRLIFSDMLPPSVSGIVCVLENSLGQVTTYEINRAEATYLGSEDLHDPAFDDMERSINVGQTLKSTSGPETRSFTAVDISTDFLEYTLRVYPSEEFKSLYVNSEPIQEAAAAAGIFGVAMIIFILYDCCVQRRQRIVLDRAVKATAVVSSLFPEGVREKIINDESNDVQKVSRAHAFRKSQIEQGKMVSPGATLAEKYAECTVFFADLAGFTKWSSTREPEQVFRLLEAMFKEFDAIALRRGVFKVETIGDCYMAVTGLPKPQPDHAVRMAKFALDCLQKLDEVTAQLSEELGEGTDDLTLRIGMHSGEVTAGVLRGDKSRFQLFGDTVNTASRMESTGLPRQVQVSQTTADSLILHGKSNWLTARADKVVAKGKGEMQTYFLHMKELSSMKSASHGESSTTMLTTASPEVVSNIMHSAD